MNKDTIASNVGRPPKFKTPEELAAKAEGYFQYCDTHPMETYVKKDAGTKKTGGDNKAGSEAKAGEGKVLVPRPYTFDGLVLWLELGMNWRDFRAYHSNDEFSAVIRTLDARVRDQQVSGAMVGMYNPNLVARLNGIAEKVEANVNTEQQQTADEALKTLKGQK